MNASFRSSTLFFCSALLCLLMSGCGDGTTTQDTRFGNGQLQTRLTVRALPGGGYVNDGPYWVYYQNGQVKEHGTYKQGVFDGVATHYYESGQKMAESTWSEGRMLGAWKRWDQKGNPLPDENAQGPAPMMK